MLTTSKYGKSNETAYIYSTQITPHNPQRCCVPIERSRALEPWSSRQLANSPTNQLANSPTLKLRLTRSLSHTLALSNQKAETARLDVNSLSTDAQFLTSRYFYSVAKKWRLRALADSCFVNRLSTNVSNSRTTVQFKNQLLDIVERSECD